MVLGLTMIAWPALSDEAGGGTPANREVLVSGYHLGPVSATTAPGGTVELRLVHCLVKGGLLPVDAKAGQTPEASSPGGQLKLTIGDVVEVTSSGNAEPPPGNDLELTIGDAVEVKPGGDAAQTIPGGHLELTIGDVVEVTPGSRDRVPPHLVCEGDDGYEQYAAILPSKSVPVDVQWSVDGPGRVSGNKMSATYFAPASKPSPNEATVTVAFKHPLQIDGKSYPDAKHLLLSHIRILDEVKTYTGTFSANDVSVNEEYTRNLTGKIRWTFDEYDAEGGWREYTGSGRASLKVNRTGCGTADFEDVPVEGRLKVHDDGSYEFLINLVGEEEQTRTCKRPELSEDLQWEETFSSGGDAVSSGDPCGMSEFYPLYTDKSRLAFERKGACSNVMNRYDEKWTFRATE